MVNSITINENIVLRPTWHITRYQYRLILISFGRFVGLYWRTSRYRPVRENFWSFLWFLTEIEILVIVSFQSSISDRFFGNQNETIETYQYQLKRQTLVWTVRPILIGYLYTQFDWSRRLSYKIIILQGQHQKSQRHSF